KDSLFALVPRNVGPELVRLDAARGKPLWSVPVLPAAFDVQTAAVDAQAVYFACRDTLQARAVQNGRLLWKQKLPGAFQGWQTLRAGEVLLVYPRDNARLPLLQTNPHPFSWPVLLRTANGSPERALLILDPRSGQWLQRLPLSPEPGPITVQPSNN